MTSYSIDFTETATGCWKAKAKHEDSSWTHTTQAYQHQVSAEMKAVRAIVVHNSGFDFRLTCPERQENLTH